MMRYFFPYILLAGFALLGFAHVGTAVAQPFSQPPQPPQSSPPPPVQQMLAKISYLLASDQHLTSRPWSGVFQALNGDIFRVEQFYHSKNPQFNIKMGLYAAHTKSTAYIINLHYDNGFDSALYDAQPYLGLGLSAHRQLNKYSRLSWHLLDVLQLGGNTRERPCYDTFRREFHCGTGLAWSDVKNRVGADDIKPRFMARLTHLF